MFESEVSVNVRMIEIVVDCLIFLYIEAHMKFSISFHIN